MKHLYLLGLISFCVPTLRLSLLHRASLFVVLIEWMHTSSLPTLPIVSPETTIMMGMLSVWGLNFALLAGMLGYHSNPTTTR